MISILAMLVILNPYTAIEADTITGVYVQRGDGNVRVEFADIDGKLALTASSHSFEETVKMINEAKSSRLHIK